MKRVDLLLLAPVFWHSQYAMIELCSIMKRSPLCLYHRFCLFSSCWVQDPLACAYSDPSGPLIPSEVGHHSERSGPPFRAKWSTVPSEVGHRSGRKWRHSRPFTDDEYRALGMPFCHLLPFTESHQWEQHTRHFDFRGSQWKEWVDYVARSHCAELSEDCNLIGYFYSDCPTWVHERAENAWRGPIFDPERLKTESGRKELSELGRAYYKTTHDAIRRYDQHHLILGDRYEANAFIAMEVVKAALPFVDVLSFQDFRDPVAHLDEWHTKTGKPVLLADAAELKEPVPPGGFVPRGNGTQMYWRLFSTTPAASGFICAAPTSATRRDAAACWTNWNGLIGRTSI